jgi:FdhD protein
VGRHNAVDKVVGEQLLMGRMPLPEHVLQVSGRLSFEIVQKAAVAGIPIVTAVSAPSSLAVDAAERFGMTLVGFVRDGRCNIYTHPERVV